MVRGAIDTGVPVLGICRGMQILNVALGGTLQQNLVDADGNHPHRRLKGTFEGNEHEVILEPGSLAARAVGEDVHIGRCHHHQAVRDVGDGLVVTGRAADEDVIEALEAEDGRWVLGVQWHPEADEKSRLFAALADAARENLGRRADPVSKRHQARRRSAMATARGARGHGRGRLLHVARAGDPQRPL